MTDEERRKSPECGWRHDCPFDVMARLAIGLIEQHEQARQGNIPFIAAHLKPGLEKLSLFCISYGVLPPQHHKEVVEWLHLPASKWPGAVGALMAEAGLHGSLLAKGIPTDFAYELKKRSHTSEEKED